MKKLLALLLTSVMATAAASGCVAVAEHAPQAQDGENVIVSAAETDGASAVYLVPGSYVDENNEVKYNTVPSAKKLSDAECTAVKTENAYLCEAAAGQPLPLPSTERAGYDFNGWWGIENATVTYYTEVPEATGVTYLYADWRTALSQPMDPVVPGDDEIVKPTHYLSVNRTMTGEKLIIPLLVSGTDVPNAVQAGYGAPVQFFNEWFYLQPGDIVQVYVSRVYGSDAVVAPQLRNSKRSTQMESSGSNHTSSYLLALTDDTSNQFFNGDYTNSINGDPRWAYKADEGHNFRIYIKFYDAGGHMTIYMENMDK